MAYDPRVTQARRTALELTIANLIKNEMECGHLSEAEVLDVIHCQLAYFAVRRHGVIWAITFYRNVIERLRHTRQIEALAQAKPEGSA